MSAGSSSPPSSTTRSSPPSDRSSLGRVFTRMRTPLDSHQRRIMPLAVGFIIRETMRPLRTRMVRSTPMCTRPCMMMHPTKPAPICTMRVPGFAIFMKVCTSSRVQQVCTPGRSMPGIFWSTGVAPEATSRRS